MGRNPRTGEPVFMETKQILHFRAGGHILDRLNRPTPPG
jgi:integration host factor subunit beta